MLSTIFSKLSASDGIPWEDTEPEMRRSMNNPGETMIRLVMSFDYEARDYTGLTTNLTTLDVK